MSDPIPEDPPENEEDSNSKTRPKNGGGSSVKL